MRFAFACLAAVVIAAPAHGWNAKGHMVIARLVWLKLTPDQRATAVDILKSHPHYDEFLTADRPENIPEDQWVFLRSATWPDWVRNHHQAQFHRSQWHYVNLPYIPPGSDINAADHPPAPVNVMERIPYCVKMIRSGNQEDRAIHFCWLMHLVGDIHQPLHCVALFNAQFPDGDRGGNLAIVGVGRGQKNLHSFWDGIMGEKISLSEIGGTAAKIDEMVKSDPTLIGDDLANHPSPEEWAKE